MWMSTIRLTFFVFNIRSSIGLYRDFVNFIQFGLLIDNILTFNTGFIKNGIVITDRHQIALNYLKDSFVADVCV